MGKMIGVFRERLKGTSSSSVTSLFSKYVHYGTIIKICRVVCYNGDSAARDVEVHIDGKGYDHNIEHINGISSGEWADGKPEIFLDQRERLEIKWISIAAAKTMEAHITGELYRREDIIGE